MTPLQQAAQALESGALLCEVTAASMLRVALEAEQAQSQNERIISDANATRKEFYRRIGDAINGEQAQAVEPVAWMHPSRDPHLLSHSAYTYGSASVPLYLHPAPPLAGERAELIADLRLNHEYCPKEVILEAADMLEADASQITKLESSLDFYRRRVELLQTWQSKMRDPERTIACDIIANGQTLPPENAGDRYKIQVEAQQVAVPMTEAQIFECDPVPHVMFDQQRIDFARAIEAFHGIGVKPHAPE